MCASVLYNLILIIMVLQSVGNYDAVLLDDIVLCFIQVILILKPCVYSGLLVMFLVRQHYRCNLHQTLLPELFVNEGKLS
jgi:hypothetical protein